MDRKKVIIAIILFIFLGLTVFTFANPDDEVSKLNDDTASDLVSGEASDTDAESSDSDLVSGEASDTDAESSDNETIATNDESTGGRLTINQSTGTTSATNNATGTESDSVANGENTAPTTPGTSDNNENADAEDYSELIALVDELIKKVNEADELGKLTDARKFNITEDIVNSVTKVTDSEVKKTLEQRLNNVLSILNDTTNPVVLINEEAVKEVYNGNVDITVEDMTATKTKSIKLNGEEIDNIDTLVDGNYEITIVDAAYNETTIKFTYDATAPKATRVEILNNTHYDSKENVTVINKGETLRVMVWFDEDLKDSAKLTIDGDRTVTLRKSSALTNEDKNEYVYYYDYIIRQDLAQGEINFVVNEYTDEVGNAGTDITAIKNSNYGTVIYDSVAPTVTYSVHSSQVRIYANEKVTLNVKGWTKKNTGKEWRKTLDAGREYTVIATDDAGNATTIVIDRILPVVEKLTLRSDGKHFDLTASEPIVIEHSSWYSKTGTNDKTWVGKYSQDKVYTLTIKDYVGNETVVTIDHKKPTAQVSYSETELTNQNITVTVKFDETVREYALTSQGWTKVDDITYTKVYEENVNENIEFRDIIGNKNSFNVTIENIDKESATLNYSIHGTHAWITSSEEITISGTTRHEDKNGNVDWRIKLAAGKEYTLTATDLAGNTTIIVIDRVLPTAEVSYDITTPTNENVTATMITSEEINTPDGWTKVDATTYTKVYEENIDENVEITDLVGNRGTANIKIENIDREPATVTYSVHGSQVRIYANEVVTLNVKGWTNKNSGKEWRKTLDAGKEYTVIATDEAGNTTTIVIDRVLPTAEVSYDITVLTNTNVTATMVTSEEINTPDGWTKVDATTYTKVYEKNVDENVEITDLVGNRGTANVTIENIDKEPAEIREVRIENYYNVNGNKNYAKVGDKIAVIVNTTELLADDPTIVIGNKEVKVPVQEPQFNKYVVYVTLTEDMGLVDGEKIEITIKGLKDLAGNVSEEVSTVGTENYYVIFDKTNPDVQQVVFKNVSNSEHSDYAKAGDKVWVYLNVTERLGQNPVFTINGQSAKIVQYENGDNWNQPWEKYVAEYVVTEDTKEENISFEITNIIDKAGNILNRVVTQDDVSTSVLVDTTKVDLQADSIESGNPQIHGIDKNPFTVNVKLNGETVRTDQAYLNNDGTYGLWFGIGYMSDGNYTIEALDWAGNKSVKEFKLDRLEITNSTVGSNYIDVNANTIHNFNSFAIKFNRDITIKNYSNDQGFKIEFEYSTDGVNYTKSTGTIINNYWTNTLMKSSTEKYTGDEFTISAGSPILWSGTKVGSRWTDIYDAILATSGTENKVYVRTIFTIIQPTYEK